RDSFVRNVLYAVGNSGRPALAAEAQRLLAAPAAVVRGAAGWALARLLSPAEFEALRTARAPAEAGLAVAEERRRPPPGPARQKPPGPAPAATRTPSPSASTSGWPRAACARAARRRRPSPKGWSASMASG